MLIVGMNLLIIAKEIGVPIKAVRTYKLDNSSSVTLYETTRISELLELSNEFYKRYNAWISIPGEYTGCYIRIVPCQVKGKILMVPQFFGSLLVEAASDLFSYIYKQRLKKVRIFDVAWTIARVNNMSFKELLDTYAIEW